MTDTRSHDTAPPDPPTPGARITGAAGSADPRGDVAGGGWRIALLVGLTVLLGLAGGVGWLVIIAAITVMIFLHELGHYLTAKWSGMKVTEFFLFFGPKLWSFRRGETEYGIKLIPVGAYVRIIGMNNLDPVPPEDEPRTFRQQSYPKRLLVVSAGSLMHFLQAFVLFVVAFGWLGVPAYSEEAERLGSSIDETDWVIGTVTADSAAARAGMEAGDDLVSIDGTAIETFDDVGPVVTELAGERVVVVYEHDGTRVERRTTIGEHPEDPSRGFLGVSGSFPDRPPVTGGPVRSVVVAGEYTASIIKQTVVGLGGFFTGGVGEFASDVVEGGGEPTPTGTPPASGGGGRVADEGDDNRLVSIYGIARVGASMDLEQLVILMALVNVSIGVLNLIPLLPLDGGHVAIATYERIRSIGGRRYMADVSRILPLAYAVFLFLILIGVSSIYLDIVDPIDLG
ncbi:MAG: M50 family metallopeptidase [Acidimicrobiales bacterium]